MLGFGLCLGLGWEEELLILFYDNIVDLAWVLVSGGDLDLRRDRFKGIKISVKFVNSTGSSGGLRFDWLFYGFGESPEVLRHLFGAIGDACNYTLPVAFTEPIILILLSLCNDLSSLFK